MHAGKKRYMTLSDHPLFKAVGVITTVIVMSILFLLTFKGSIDTAMVFLWPCVFILIWAGIKRRLFWLLWLIPTGLAYVIMTFFAGIDWLVSAAAYTYWFISALTCLMLILGMSSEQKRVHRVKQQHLEDEKAYMAAVKNSAPRHDASLDALLDSLGNQPPENRT